MSENLWDRAEAESDRAWAAFQAYRDLGPLHRTIRKVAAEQRPNSGRHVEGWSSRHSWVARARSWDEHLDQERQRAHIQEVSEMAVRHARASQQAVRALLAPAEALLAYMMANGGPEALTTQLLEEGKLRTLVDLAARAARAIPGLQVAERLARGEPTQITQGVDRAESVMGDPDRIAEVLRILKEAGVLVEDL